MSVISATLSSINPYSYMFLLGRIIFSGIHISLLPIIIPVIHCLLLAIQSDPFPILSIVHIIKLSPLTTNKTIKLFTSSSEALSKFEHISMTDQYILDACIALSHSLP